MKIEGYRLYVGSRKWLGNPWHQWAESTEHGRNIAPLLLVPYDDVTILYRDVTSAPSQHDLAPYVM